MPMHVLIYPYMLKKNAYKCKKKLHTWKMANIVTAAIAAPRLVDKNSKKNWVWKTIAIVKSNLHHRLKCLQ